MNVIDARSGRENLKPGDIVDYGPAPATMIVVDSSGYIDAEGVGRLQVTSPRSVPNPNAGHREWWKLLRVFDYFVGARALVEYHQEDGVTWKKWVPLRVRFNHPGFPGQRVAFTLT